MSIGSSGRIVIEVAPGVKRELYAALTRDGSTLKEWFLRNAQAYLLGNRAEEPYSLLTEVTEIPSNRTPAAQVHEIHEISLANSEKK